MIRNKIGTSLSSQVSQSAIVTRRPGTCPGCLAGGAVTAGQAEPGRASAAPPTHNVSLKAGAMTHGDLPRNLLTGWQRAAENPAAPGRPLMQQCLSVGSSGTLPTCAAMFRSLLPNYGFYKADTKFSNSINFNGSNQIMQR